jgi:hypothetical protein
MLNLKFYFCPNVDIIFTIVIERFGSQDLLPHLPNFTEIELFQEEICQSLQTCGDNIQYLKNLMRDLAETTDTTVLVRRLVL